MQNRGGLFSINDDTYHFKSVETSGVAKGTPGEGVGEGGKVEKSNPGSIPLPPLLFRRPLPNCPD